MINDWSPMSLTMTRPVCLIAIGHIPMASIRSSDKPVSLCSCARALNTMYGTD